MAQDPKSRLTPLELEIMKALWNDSPATVQGVRERLAANDRELAYTTVQTMLNVLLRKGRVSRARAGRAFAYAPKTTRGQAVRQALGDLVHRLFDGSAESLVMGLVDSRQLSPEELARLSALVSRAEAAAAKPEGESAASRSERGGGDRGQR